MAFEKRHVPDMSKERNLSIYILIIPHKPAARQGDYGPKANRIEYFHYFQGNIISLNTNPKLKHGKVRLGPDQGQTKAHNIFNNVTHSSLLNPVSRCSLFQTTEKNLLEEVTIHFF